MRTSVGKKFGRLTVIGTLEKRFICLCDCRTICDKQASNVRSGKTRSCGCLNREVTRERNFKHGGKQRAEVSGEYNNWVAMRQRCSNPNIKHYSNYGGRGISICGRWDSFAAFREDMGPRPSKKHSIDRINVDGNYEPGNCRWATPKEQRKNQRPQDYGKKLTAKDVADIKLLLKDCSFGTQTLIAKHFGVSSRTISKIKLGSQWKGVGANEDTNCPRNEIPNVHRD